MIICKKCGTSYDEFATYCNFCDVTLDDAAGNILKNSTGDKVNEVSMTLPKRRLIKIHQTLGTLQIVLIGGLAYEFLVHDSPTLFRTSMLLLLLMFTQIHFATASGIKKGKNWAQNVSMLIGFILLVGFPIGTVIGGFMLYNLFSKNYDSSV